MKGKNQNIILVFAVIVSLIIGIIIGKLVFNSNSINAKTVEEVTENVNAIRLDEDLSVNGTIKNLENATWNNAKIVQVNNKLNLELMIDNNSETEKIDATTLTVELLNQDGGVIFSKKVEMKEIPANGGYTTINLDFDTDGLVIIYNINITA